MICQNCSTATISFLWQKCDAGGLAKVARLGAAQQMQKREDGTGKSSTLTLTCSGAALKALVTLGMLAFGSVVACAIMEQILG